MDKLDKWTCGLVPLVGLVHKFHKSLLSKSPLVDCGLVGQIGLVGLVPKVGLVEMSGHVPQVQNGIKWTCGLVGFVDKWDL